MAATGHTTVAPTLDDERRDQLRSYLTSEVTASPAAGLTDRRPASQHRLLLAGVTAVLVAGIVASGLVWGGGPFGTPAAEAAVAIEQEHGWTTIRLLDATADPRAVLAELEAAGIDARIEILERSADGNVGIRMTVDPEHPRAVYVSMLDSPAPVGLAVTVPPELAPQPQPGDPTGATDTTAPFDPTVDEADLDAAGIRLGPDSISVRNDAGHQMIILTAD